MKRAVSTAVTAVLVIGGLPLLAIVVAGTLLSILFAA
jgi:hypothetical protein